MDQAKNIEADIGVIGLAVMGQNLILNMNDHGFKVVAYNRTTEKVDAFLEGSASGTQIQGARVGKIGQVVNIEFIMEEVYSGEDEDIAFHPAWPKVLLGSRLLEIVIGAVSADCEHMFFPKK